MLDFITVGGSDNGHGQGDLARPLGWETGSMPDGDEAGERSGEPGKGSAGRGDGIGIERGFKQQRGRRRKELF